MHAEPGDRIIVKGHKVGNAERIGRVVEVRGSEGSPPYLVAWEHSESTHLFFPGTDVVIDHRPDNAK